jgi:hypothetical protein
MTTAARCRCRHGQGAGRVRRGRRRSGRAGPTPARGRLVSGRCGRVSARYDRGEGRRRWRTLGLGGVRCEVEAEAPQVVCDIHGVVVATVPWARHGAGHTRSVDDLAFDRLVARLAVQSSTTAVSELTQIAWSTVGAIIARVADARAERDPFDELVTIGIDEISSTRGHRSLTVVVDHATGRLIWAAVGRDTATRAKFFDPLGPERAGRLTVVTADGRLDRRRRRARPDSGAVYRWFSRGAVGDRRPRPTPARDVERRSSRRPRGPETSRAPATPRGRTPPTSPNATRPSSPGWPRSPRASPGPTSSQRAACGDRPRTPTQS